MPIVTPRQFFHTLYPDPMVTGHLVLWTETARSGAGLAQWTHNVEQAGRLGHAVRKTRNVRFCATLQEKEGALAVARERRPKAPESAVWGSEASAVLLCALWVEIETAVGREPDGCPRPPTWLAAQELLSAVPRPASILVDTGRRLEAYWLLAEPLAIATGADRSRARRLLRRLQEAVSGAGRARGWEVSGTTDLAARLRLPGTLNHALPGAPAIEVLRFPYRAEVAGARYRARDFASLPAPAADPRVDARLLCAVPPRFGGGRPGDFLRVVRRCSFLRFCLNRRASLPMRKLLALIAVAGRCEVAGTAGRRLVHRICRAHPGYSPILTDAYLDRQLASEPPACEWIADALGARGRHCGTCDHLACCSSPLALGFEPADPEDPPPPSGSGDAAHGAPPQVPATGREAPPVETSSAAGPAPAATGASIGDLVAGVAEVLDALGRPATAAEVLAELAPGRPAEAHARLRAALAAFFPAAQPITAGLLARRLGALVGFRIEGLAIERLGRTDRGALWTVRWQEEVA